MSRSDDDDSPGVYGFAPENRLDVSGAAHCTSTLSADKQAAVQSYLTKLGPDLQQRYGRQNYYEPNQVQTSALGLGLNIDYMCWAYVLFCSVPDFERIHAAAGESCDYDSMRETVGTHFFNGDLNFDVPGVVDAMVAAAGQVGSTAVDAGAGAVDLLGGLADLEWFKLGDLL